MPRAAFVSGASGFIAQHIIKQFLSDGYRVVGSVRTSDKGEYLTKRLKSDHFSYEIVPDIGAPGAFIEALKKNPDLTVFCHTASPFTMKVKDTEKELLDPAVNGTKNALYAVKNHGGNISKVLMTSAYATMMHTSGEQPTKADDENSWNPITWEKARRNQHMAYIASKVYSEKAAWDFVANEQPHFSFNSINPSFVFGPRLFDEEANKYNTTSEIIKGLLKLKNNSKIPPLAGFFVDVRDVAKAHLVAVEKGLKNERLSLRSSLFSAQDIIHVMKENFPHLHESLPSVDLETATKLKAKFPKSSDERTRKLLEIPFIDLKTTITDTVSQLLELQEQQE